MISETASTASWSASTAISSHASGPAPAGTTPPLQPELLAEAGSRDVLVGVLRVGLQCLALLLAELRRDDDVDEDVEVAANPGPAEMRDAATTQPDLRAGLGAGLDLDLLLA